MLFSHEFEDKQNFWINKMSTEIRDYPLGQGCENSKNTSRTTAASMMATSIVWHTHTHNTIAKSLVSVHEHSHISQWQWRISDDNEATKGNKYHYYHHHHHPAITRRNLHRPPALAIDHLFFLFFLLTLSSY